MEWRIRTRSRMNAADHKTSQPGTRKLEHPLVEVLRLRMGTLDNDQFKGASTDTRAARPRGSRAFRAAPVRSRQCAITAISKGCRHDA